MLGKKPLKPLSILPRRLLHSCLKSHCPNFVDFFPNNIQAKLEGKLLAFRSPQHFVWMEMSWSEYSSRHLRTMEIKVRSYQ